MSIDIEVSIHDCEAAVDDAKCLGRFNRKEQTEPYRKPKALVNALKQMYHNHTPKLTAQQMQEELRRMRDPKDGGLMFCWSKRGIHVTKDLVNDENWPGCEVCGAVKSCECNGMVPSVSQIQGWISQETQREKKRKHDEVVDV